MKKLILLIPLLSCGQHVKDTLKLTPLQLKTIQYNQLQILNIYQQAKIQAEPLNVEIQNIAKEVCTKIGIPIDRVEFDCIINKDTGIVSKKKQEKGK